MTAAEEAPQREKVQCARPGCPATFIPRHKDHKFCSARCKTLVHAYRHVLRGKP